MTLCRDRLLDTQGRSWVHAGSQTFSARVISPSSRECGSGQGSYKNHWLGSAACRVSSPYVGFSDRYDRDVVDDMDRLPSSYRHHRAASVNPSYSRCSYGRASDRGVNCRWVADDAGDDYSSSNRNNIDSNTNSKNRCGGSESYLQGDAGERHVAWKSIPSRRLQQRQPSSLLVSLANAVALRRGTRCPPIPQEVIIAFQSSVARGTFMLKFIPHGAPHKRFFVIRFLERRMHHAEPEPVLSWYASTHSWNMRRYLPLADLIAVVDGGNGHPAVEKRMVEPGLIKGSYVDMRATYLRADFILQLHFRSSTGGEELLAVKLLDKSSYIAWRIVTDFFSSIGSVLIDGV